MRFGFDLDGTLDKPAVRALALSLIDAGHEVHIITGCFLEAGDWQNHMAKYRKLEGMGFGRCVASGGSPFLPLVLFAPADNVRVEILDAVDGERYDREYRLVDLGLRKGAYIAQWGIEMMFEDSELYCKTIPAMCGTQVVHVR